MSELAERLEAVQGAIRESARLAGRGPDEITTIAITKFHPASLVRELVELGVTDIGENRHQDAAPKAAELSDLAIRWHFVGQLQTKKARQVRSYATVIHSVDRVNLVDALDRSEPDAGKPDSSERPVDCFVQVNLTEDAGRGGVEPADLDSLVDRVLSARGLRLLGLMAVAPLGQEPRRAFARVRELSERVRQVEPMANKLSMGMSGDFEAAILEGATHLRIGTAITGIRPTSG